MSDLECSDINNSTAVDFFGDGSRCTFATDYCSGDSILNYQSWIECAGEDQTPFVILGLITWLCYLIMLLASTADNFFVIELQTLSTMLALSDDVAGVTLLALGNGAPDVFTAVVGLGQDDFQLALSDLMGGGIFINTVVLGSVILCTNKENLEVDKGPFLRDLGMYILCTSGIFFFCLDGVVTMMESLGFIFVYFAYIVIVLVSSKSKVDETVTDIDALKLENPLIGSSSNDPVFDALMDGRDSLTSVGRESSVARDSLRQYSTNSHAPSHHSHKIAADDDHILGFNDVPELNEDGILAMVLWYAEYPVSVLRHLSIPSADPFWCRKRRLFSALSPILGLQLVILAVFGVDGFTSTKLDWLGNVDLWLVTLLVSSTVSIVLWNFSNDEQQPSFFLFSVMFAFLMSVVWLDLVANEVVAILETFGMLANISTSILGLTVLAWGNSVGDLVADTATAKAGQVKTAIATCFGSPLLSALVGLGLALTISTSSDGNLATSINTQNLVAIVTLLFVLFSSGITFWKYNFKPPRVFAYYLYAIYGFFMALSIALEVAL
ncbi:hypothetical protein TrLO_g13409 [Triparma laevis f. longispina]|uniref:Sodium/calcium exchanger membrane region domain-containing protein n=1 Tax=Triparma laevis f. longispina TaxID=1714387 RepID=A0A9W7FSI3_9STRA|nr:hypothetical protein TrLO_g13409 [Triparma laevis f. longispina]